MNKFKIVFSSDNQDKIGVILSYIRKLISDIGVENLEIQMMTYGEAVNVFVRNTSEFEPLLNDLAEKQVKFYASSNSIRSIGIQTNELLDFVTVAPTDGDEIVEKKTAGWSYISL